MNMISNKLTDTVKFVLCSVPDKNKGRLTYQKYWNIFKYFNKIYFEEDV